MDGIELKQRRNNLDLTQQGLADEFGVERNTINRWENGIIKEVPKWVDLALITLESRHKETRKKLNKKAAT
jgi:DNA-binding XRE family transcriptional regulator